jgi:hypothetical protein
LMDVCVYWIPNVTFTVIQWWDLTTSGIDLKIWRVLKV